MIRFKSVAAADSNANRMSVPPVIIIIIIIIITIIS